MKMPLQPDISLFAPCGMNCTVCYKHLAKKPCEGCLNGDLNKSNRCTNCKIKICAQEKEAIYCYNCPDFPCLLIENMDRSYRKRYGVSLIEYGKLAKENGLESFLSQHNQEWTCPDCGGAYSLHDGICSECQRIK